jgi:hypothetical protein
MTTAWIWFATSSNRSTFGNAGSFGGDMVFLITGWSSALVAGRLEHADGLLRARATGAILGRKWLLSAARCAPGGRGQPSLSLKKPPLTDDSGTLK